MITKTVFTTTTDLIQKALYALPEKLLSPDGERVTINQPIGDFFYDPWKIKEEFKGTVWEELYNSLDVKDKGEARIIRLNSGSSYISHADMDDRYHLNLAGVNCFLIDLDNKVFHELDADGIWYSMDASRIHTAANFGNRVRFQLVVRKLLNLSVIDNPVNVTLKAKTGIDKDDARYLFDSQVSPWLNKANKQNKISNFKIDGSGVSFKTTTAQLDELKSITTNFDIT